LLQKERGKRGKQEQSRGNFEVVPHFGKKARPERSPVEVVGGAIARRGGGKETGHLKEVKERAHCPFYEK